LAALAPAGASADQPFSYLTTPDGAVMLVVPEGVEGPSPVVLVLPDALGPDRRSQPYLELLNAHGVATVELLPAGDDGRGTAPDPAENDPAGILAALAADPRVDPSRLGVLASGAGGAIALGDPALAGVPVALLYPDCAGLPPAGRPVLLLHGGMDPTDPPGACARWTAAGGRLARRHEYAGAAYGWDYFDGPWADGFALLPSPGASGRRVWARSDPVTTADAVSRVADFLTAELDTAGAPR
jgi:dienelactone hydrolase